MSLEMKVKFGLLVETLHFCSLPKNTCFKQDYFQIEKFNSNIEKKLREILSIYDFSGSAKFSQLQKTSQICNKGMLQRYSASYPYFQPKRFYPQLCG